MWRAVRLGLAVLVAGAAAPAALAEPPPIEAFFGAPAFESLRLSPSGDHIAAIQNSAG